MNKTQFVSGIYQINNTKTKESYIGSSKNVYQRLYDHMVENGFNLKSDQEKSRTLMQINPTTKDALEELDIGSINTTLETLVKLYKNSRRDEE